MRARVLHNRNVQHDLCARLVRHLTGEKTIFRDNFGDLRVQLSFLRRERAIWKKIIATTSEKNTC